MSKYKSYRDRVKASGETIQDAVIGTTKRQTTSFIMNSPSLKYVKLNDELITRPCIVSDKDSFDIRKFLFLPDTIINVGDYIHYDSFIYLATDRKRDEIYPELNGELCNESYKVAGGQTKQIIGYDEYTDRPKYSYIKEEYFVPCVMTTKSYSTADNSSIPLPDSSMIVKLPYIEGMYPKINAEFIHRGSQYQVTDVSYENVIASIGYVEIRLRWEANTNVSN
jgi:hypothetical protein